MAEDRRFFLTDNIRLTLNRTDVRGISTVSQVRILYDKQVIATTTNILVGAEGWQVNIDTGGVDFRAGLFEDRWYYNGNKYYDKQFELYTIVNPIGLQFDNSLNYKIKDMSMRFKYNQNNSEIQEVYDEVAVAQNILAVMLTTEGELINSGCGTNLIRKLFTQFNDEVSNEIRNEIEVRLPIQVPEIEIDNVEVVSDDLNKTITVTAVYYYKQDASRELYRTGNTFSRELSV